jgi:hypothetical protein
MCSHSALIEPSRPRLTISRGQGRLMFRFVLYVNVKNPPAHRTFGHLSRVRNPFPLHAGVANQETHDNDLPDTHEEELVMRRIS